MTPLTNSSLSLIRRTWIMCATAWMPLCAGAQAEAPLAPTVQQLERVELQAKSQKISAIPYKMFNQVLYGVQRHGEGLVKVEARLEDLRQARGQARTWPRGAAALSADDDYIPLSVDPWGRMNMPAMPPEKGQRYEFVTVLPKDSTGWRMTFDLAYPVSELTLQKVRDTMRVAHTLRTELLPFWLRWMFPSLGGIGLCNSTGTFALAWEEDGKTWHLPLPVDPSVQRRKIHPDSGVADDPQAPLLPCTVLTGRENWPAHAKLVAPADTQATLVTGHR